MPPLTHPRAENASESAALQGHQPKTPIIAGSVSGGCIALAWTIGFIIYLVKRKQRERQAIAAGFKSHKDFVVTEPLPNNPTVIIPPDPAVVGLSVEPQTQDREKVQGRKKAVAGTAPYEQGDMPPSADSSLPLDSMLVASNNTNCSTASFLSTSHSELAGQL